MMGADGWSPSRAERALHVFLIPDCIRGMTSVFPFLGHVLGGTVSGLMKARVSALS